MSSSIFNCKIRNCVFDKSQLSKVKFSYLVIDVEWSHRCKYIEAELPNLQLPPAHSDKEIWKIIYVLSGLTVKLCLLFLT